MTDRIVLETILLRAKCASQIDVNPSRAEIQQTSRTYCAYKISVICLYQTARPTGVLGAKRSHPSSSDDHVVLVQS